MHIRGIATIGIAALSAVFCLSAKAQPVGLLPERHLNHYALKDNQQSNQHSPRVVTDGKGNWLSMWKSGTGGSSDANASLSFASSTTTGTTWGPTMTLSVPDSSAIKADLAYAGDDKWVVVWFDAIGSQSQLRRVYASVSDDVGQTWSTPKKIRETNSADSFPLGHLHLKSDGEGKLLAVWMELETVRVHYTSHSADFGESWSAPVQATGLDYSPSEDQPLGLAAAGENTWLLVYQDEWVYSVAKSENNGATWTDLGRLFAKPTNYRQLPDVDIVCHDGRAVIAVAGPYIPGVWTQEDPRAVFVFSSDESQTTFTTPQLIDQQADISEGYAGGNVSLSTDAAGNWLLATKLEGLSTAPIKLWHTDDVTTPWTLVHELDHGVNAEVDIAGAGVNNFAVILTHFGSEAAASDLDIVGLGSFDGNTWSDPVYINGGAAQDFPLINDFNVDMAAGDNAILATWAVMYVYPPGSNSSENVRRIMLSRSLDDGRTWEPARELNSASGLVSTIRYLGSSTWECTWETDLFTNEFYKSVSTDNGLTWSDPVPAPAPPESGKHIAIADNGEWVGTITEVTMDPGTRIYTLNTYAGISSDNGVTWHSPSLILSESRAEAPVGTDYKGEPNIVSLGNGRFALLGKHIYKGRDVPFDANRILQFHAFLSESHDNGRTWSAPETVSNSTRVSQLAPQLSFPIVASNGRIVIAWSEYGEQEDPSGQDSDIIYRSKTFGSLTAARDWSLYE